ncbi:MAG: HAD hydrolase family protein [Pseudomonadota bacterium]
MFASAPPPTASTLRTTGRLTADEIDLRLRSVELVFFDFDGVFTDNRVAVDQNGVEQVFCCRSDGLGLSKLRRLGVDAMIVSTERNPVVGVRAQKLAMDCVQGVEDKAETIGRLAFQRGVSLERTCFVGNDVNDVAAMALCCLAITVADAWPEAYAAAHLVTTRRGGEGAVREICDVLVAARGQGLSK